jgi:hypothetical protein
VLLFALLFARATKAGYAIELFGLVKHQEGVEKKRKPPRLSFWVRF